MNNEYDLLRREVEALDGITAMANEKIMAIHGGKLEQFMFPNSDKA